MELNSSGRGEGQWGRGGVEGLEGSLERTEDAKETEDCRAEQIKLSVT